MLIYVNKYAQILMEDLCALVWKATSLWQTSAKVYIYNIYGIELHLKTINSISVNCSPNQE